MSIRIKCVIIVVLILGLLKIRSYQEEQIGIKICAFMAFSGTWNIDNYINT